MTRPRTTFAAALLTFTYGCADAPTQLKVATNLRPVTAQIVDRVQVCHVDENGVINGLYAAGPSLAAHLGHGDARGGILSTASATFSASSSANTGTTPEWAFDGVVEAWSSWNSGSFPTQWIEVDFGAPVRFSRIEAVVNQLPLSGNTSHSVTLDGTAAFDWTGFTNHLDVLSHSFSAIQQAQRIRITTTASPSWVAWFEIRVIGC